MNNEEYDANSLPKSQDRPNGFERTLEKLLLKMLASLGRGFLSLKNASYYCDLSEKTLRRFISEGRLQDYRPARGKVLIKRKELDTLIEQSTTKIRRGRGIHR